MKASFTPKEYARLLELVWLGMQAVAGRSEEEEESPALQRYAELEQKLFELATPMGCADMVTVGADGGLVPSEKLMADERLGKILGTYENDVFWHELVHRLSDRDLASEQARLQMKDQGGPPIDSDARLKQLEDGYWAEFEKNDLANLVLLKGGRG